MLSRVNRQAIFLLLLWTFALLLLASRVSGERLPMKSYTTADGLGHNNVQRIVRDSLGFLWFCTFEGLSRFDGYNFMTYGTEQGLPSQVINDLLESSEGEYWVATDAGLCRFNPQGIPARHTSNNIAQSIESKAMFTVYSPADNAKSKKIICLLQDHAGTLWCGTAQGLYRLDQQGGQMQFRFIELGMPEVNADVTTIIEDRRQTLWIGSLRGLYHLLPDGRTEHYDSRHGLLDNYIHSLLEDRQGRIWVSTRYGGLCRLVIDPDPSRPVVARLYTTKDGLPGFWINQLFQSSDGSLWAGSNHGLIRFLPTADGKEFHFRTYGEHHGLRSRDVQALAEDNNGNLWVGMGNSGAAKLAHSGITAFDEADGIWGATAIFKDKMNDLYVITASDAGRRFVNRFDGERFTPIELKFPGVDDYGWGWNQTMLQDRAGEWWVATGQGLYHFSKAGSFDQLARKPPQAIYTIREGLASNVILRLFEDSRGDIWIGTANRHGLSRWQRATGTLHHYTDTDGLPSLSEFHPISFAEDRTGAVWIGFTVGGGLVRYRDGQFTHFAAANGLAEGGIFNLFVDSAGRLWVPTTRGGICRIDQPEAERPEILTYTVADGVSSNDVKAITEDRQGRIYLGTGRGIDRLDPATGSIRHYTANEGALLGDVLAAIQDGDGTLWFSFSSAGLVRLVPEAKEPSAPPPVRITGLRIGGETQRISAVGETEVPAAELSADKSNLQIEFVAPGFGVGEGVRYQYRLQGTDQEWSPPGEGRAVNFASLAPGTYEFEVRAVSGDGVVSPGVASFRFRVLPPLWQRWWFVMLVGLLLAVIVYQVYRYRVGRLLEMERVRTRIAADLHDDIGSSLSQIAVLSEVLRRKAGDDARLTKPLLQIASVSREAVDSMSDIVWAINPAKDHLQDLVKRMRRHASEVFPASHIEFHFDAPETAHDITLGADVRRQVFLIFKESVTNVIRHSHCDHAEVRLTVEGSQLVLEVIDNGKGFDPSRRNDGNGLVSMRRRASSLGGMLEVISASGTTIRLQVPYSSSRIRG